MLTLWRNNSTWRFARPPYFGPIIRRCCRLPHQRLAKYKSVVYRAPKAKATGRAPIWRSGARRRLQRLVLRSGERPVGMLHGRGSPTPLGCLAAAAGAGSALTPRRTGCFRRSVLSGQTSSSRARSPRRPHERPRRTRLRHRRVSCPRCRRSRSGVAQHAGLHGLRRQQRHCAHRPRKARQVRGRVHYFNLGSAQALSSEKGEIDEVLAWRRTPPM